MRTASRSFSKFSKHSLVALAIAAALMAAGASTGHASPGCDAAAAGNLDVTWWAGTTNLTFSAGETLTIHGDTFANSGTAELKVNGVTVASAPIVNGETTIVHTFTTDTVGPVSWSTLAGSSGGNIVWTLDCTGLAPSPGCQAAADGNLDVTWWAGTTNLDFSAGDMLTIHGDTFANLGTAVLKVNNVTVASAPIVNGETTIVYTFPTDTTDTVSWSTLAGSSGGNIVWTLDCSMVLVSVQEETWSNIKSMYRD